MNNQENAARSGIALILNDQKVAVGTGFLVSEQLILTCAHVIEAAAGSSGSIVSLSFLLDREKVLLKAQVEKEYWRDSNKEDVAVLKLLEVLPKEVSQSGVAPLLLGASNNTKNHSFETFGFPKGHEKDGVWGYGTVGDALDKDGQSLIQITSKEVTLGFSGAPIWDKKTQRVIGMVTSRTEPDGSSGRLEETGFFTPSEVLQKICPELKIPNFCPYLGLSAFTEKDAHLFFGRQSLIDKLVELLRKNPKFLAVVGTSGSGKSSLVRAGLFPQIKEITGFEQVKSIYQLRPSNAKTPEEALIGAFPDLQKVDVGTEDVWEKIESYLKQEECSRIVLFIDQFEELFAEFKEEEHISFAKGLNDLLEQNSNLTLIITMRSEFYTQLQVSKLGHLVPYSQVNVVGILDEQELKDVITKPAEQVGLKLEDSLIDIMIKDLKDTKNPLPLLEFTLEQLWKSENGNNLLTYDCYISPKIGRVTGAIARWANNTYDDLSKKKYSKDQKLTLKKEEVQGLIKRTFISLVRVGNENQPHTRKSLSKDDLSEVGHVQLIQDLASARLLVTEKKDEAIKDETIKDETIKDEIIKNETIEIIHEALLTEWDKLKKWIEEERPFLSWRDRLSSDLNEWKINKKAQGYLLSAAPLGEAEGYLKNRKADLLKEQKDYIEKSIKKRDRQHRLTIIGLSSFTGIALLLAGFAGWQWRQAKIGEITALQQTSEALLFSNQDFDALIASVKAFKKLKGISGFFVAFPGFKETNDIQSKVIDSLQEAVYKVREDNRLEKHTGAVNAVIFSPNNDMIASGSQDNTVQLWNLDGSLKQTLNMEDVVRNLDGSLKQTLNMKEPTKKGSVENVIFNHDGSMIATASDDGTVRLWTNNKKENKWEVHKILKEDNKKILKKDNKDKVYKVFGISFSYDRKLLATANGDGTVQLWTTGEGKRLLKKKIHDQAVLSISFSHNGKWLATASMDGTAKLWTIEGQELKEDKSFKVIKHSNWVRDVSFSHDDKMIATASKDKTVKLWDIDGTQRKEFKGKMEFRSVKFSPDKKVLAAASADRKIYLFSLDNWENIQTLTGHKDEVLANSFSSDGKLLATASKDKTIKIWKMITEPEEPLLSLPADNINLGTFSPDGKKIATASREFTGPDGKKITIVRIWSREGKKINYIEVEYPVASISFSYKNQQIAIAGQTGIVEIWDYNSPKKNKFPIPCRHKSSITSVSFSRDGKMIATASGDMIVKLCRLSLDGKKSTFIKDLKNTDNYTDPINRVRFSYDSETIFTASWKWIIDVWTSEGTLITSIDQEKGKKGHTDGVHSVSVTNDRKKLASASEDKTFKLWDIDGKSPELTFKLATTKNVGDAAVLNIIFSPYQSNPNPQQLATGGADNTVRLWEWESKSNDVKEMNTFRNRTPNPVSDLSFIFKDDTIKDDTIIAFANGGGRFILWNLNLKPEDLLDRGCKVLHDYLKTNQNIKEDSTLCD